MPLRRGCAYDTVACAAILEQLWPDFESGALKPIRIVKRFTLSEADQAFTAVNNRSLHSKAVFALGTETGASTAA